MERRAAGGRSQEGLKQASVHKMSLEQEFGVPLQAQEESMRGMFDCLDNTLGKFNRQRGFQADQGHAGFTMLQSYFQAVGGMGVH